MVAGVDIVRVLDVDPDLGEELEPSALAVARPRAVARGVWLEPGPWQPLADEWDHRGHLGLLIVEGFLTRSLQVGPRDAPSSSAPAICCGLGCTWTSSPRFRSRAAGRC